MKHLSTFKLLSSSAVIAIMLASGQGFAKPPEHANAGGGGNSSGGNSGGGNSGGGTSTNTNGYSYPIGTTYQEAESLTPGNGVDPASIWISWAQDTSNLTEISFNPLLAATNAAGIFSGNDNPLSTTGFYQDGLLNGAAQQGGQSDPALSPNNTIFQPGAFITEDDLQNLDGIDNNNDGHFNDDPGWLSLYKAIDDEWLLNEENLGV